MPQGTSVAYWPANAPGPLNDHTVYQIGDDNVAFALREAQNPNIYTVYYTAVNTQGSTHTIIFNQMEILQRHSTAISFNLIASEKQTWVIQALNDNRNRFKIQTYPNGPAPFLNKLTQFDILMDKQPVAPSWVIDGSNLFLFYSGNTNDNRILVRRYQLSLVTNSIQEFIYKSFNFYDKTDAIKMSYKSIKCRVATAGSVLSCFVDAGLHNYVMEYKYDISATSTQDFVTEIKEVSKLNIPKGFAILSSEFRGDLTVLVLKRTEVKVGLKTSDCSSIVAVYIKGNSSDPQSILTCQELNITNNQQITEVAADSQATNTVWVTVPRSSGVTAPLMNMYTFTPASITPLEFKPTPRVLQTGASEPTLADFSKASLQVMGLDNLNSGSITMDSLYKNATPTPNPSVSGGKAWIWLILIVILVLVAVAGGFYFMKKKREKETNDAYNQGFITYSKGVNDNRVDNSDFIY